MIHMFQALARAICVSVVRSFVYPSTEQIVPAKSLYEAESPPHPKTMSQAQATCECSDLQVSAV